MNRVFAICFSLATLVLLKTTDASGITKGCLLVEKKDEKLSPADSLKFTQIQQFAKKEGLYQKSFPDIELSIARYFINTPYVGNTLGNSVDEPLVINLSEFDCVTFVENVLALSFCIHKNDLSPEHFRQQIETLRYRDGVRQGYASRLHYFSEWLLNKSKRELLVLPAHSSGGSSFDARVNFISTHRDKYPALADSLVYESIKSTETQSESWQLSYFPKEQLPKLEQYLHEGDLVAITTSIKGLDIVHVGFVCKIQGQWHLLHASSEQKKVVISQLPLYNYLITKPSFTGIIPARIKE